MGPEVPVDRKFPAGDERRRVGIRHDLGELAKRVRAAQRVQADLRLIVAVDADDRGVVGQDATRDIREPIEDVPQVECDGDERQHVGKRVEPLEPVHA